MFGSVFNFTDDESMGFELYLQGIKLLTFLKYFKFNRFEC